MIARSATVSPTVISFPAASSRDDPPCGSALTIVPTRQFGRQCQGYYLDTTLGEQFGLAADKLSGKARGR
jgi:hypothetical protein